MLTRHRHQLILISIVLVVLAACGSTNRNKTEGSSSAASDPRLFILESDPGFNIMVAGSSLIKTDRRRVCDPTDFDKRVPAAWKDYQFAGSTEVVYSALRRQLPPLGWEFVRQQGSPEQVIYKKNFGQFQGALVVAVQQDMYEITVYLALSEGPCTFSPG